MRKPAPGEPQHGESIPRGRKRKPKPKKADERKLEKGRDRMYRGGFNRLLLVLLLVPFLAQAQVTIDDARVILNSGQTLEAAIAAGAIGGEPLCTAAQLAAESCGTAVAGRLAVVTDAHRNVSCEVAASGGAAPLSFLCKYSGTAPSGSWLPYPTAGTIVVTPGQYPSSTTAGLQEAIDSSACANGCTVRLPAGTYTFTCDPDAMVADQGCLDINERENIFFVGDGYDRTIISWTYNSATDALPAEPSMIRIRGRDDDAGGGPVPSSNILFHNLNLEMHDLCNPTSQTCDSGTRLPSTLRIHEAEDVQVITSQVTCDELHGDYSEVGTTCRAIWINGDEWRGTGTGGDYPSRNVWITNSKIAGSGRGLEFHLCKDCWVEGSYLFSPTEEDATLRPTRDGLIVKYHADGVRIINNTLSGGWLEIDQPMIHLIAMSGGQRNLEAGQFVQIEGNTFLNRSAQRTASCTAADAPFDCCTGSGAGANCPVTPVQIKITGYNFANIVGNVFACDNELQCSGRGIFFAAPGSNCEYPDGTVGNCNSGNLIANNIFHRWSGFDWEGEASAGFRCPIIFDNPQTLSPIDAANNNGLRNIFTGNVFDLRDGSGNPTNGPGMTGFCWSNEAFAMQVVGQNSTRVGAQGPWGPAVPVEVLLDVPCQSGNAGMVLEASDGNSATDCITGGGGNRVVCRCNGSAWAAF